MLSKLGWSNLELVKNQQLEVFDGVGWDTPKILPVQVFYELGIFSISFRGKKIPDWFIHRSNGSSITFTVPSSPNNLRGLNVGYVYTVPYNRYGDWQDIITNKTKNCRYIYEPYFRPPGATNDEESVTCIRHWMMGKNEMEEGDTITILLARPKCNDVKVIQCGISFVYDDGNKDDEDPVAAYKISLAVSKLHKCSFVTGLRYRVRFLENRPHASAPPDQFELVTTDKFGSYIPERDFYC